MERSERCPSCGTSMREWEDDPHAYTPVRVTCPGCRLRETLQSDTSEPLPKGTTIQLVTARQAEQMEVKRLRDEAEGRTGPRRRRRS